MVDTTRVDCYRVDCYNNLQGEIDSAALYREWIDERYYRDVVVTAEFRTFYTTNSSR